MTKTTLIASAEILCAKLTESVTDTDGFVANPKSYIFSMTNVNIGDNLDVQAVVNTDDTVNLTLPYYSDKTAASTPASMGEGDMESVTGGVITSTHGLSEHEKVVLAQQGSFPDKEAMHRAVHAAFPEIYGEYREPGSGGGK